MEFDVNQLVGLLVVIVGLLGSISAFAAKWRKYAKKIPKFVGMVTELQQAITKGKEIMTKFINPETGEPINLKRITKKEMEAILLDCYGAFKEGWDVYVAMNELIEDC